MFRNWHLHRVAYQNIQKQQHWDWYVYFERSVSCFVGFTHVQTPQFARGKVFASQPTEQQLQEQDKYKAYLKQQVKGYAAGGISPVGIICYAVLLKIADLVLYQPAFVCRSRKKCIKGQRRENESGWRKRRRRRGWQSRGLASRGSMRRSKRGRNERKWRWEAKIWRIERLRFDSTRLVICFNRIESKASSLT